MGFLATILLILFLSNTWSPRAVMEFIYFSPDTRIEQFQVGAARMLAIWSILSLPLLIPIYMAGANDLKCGKIWLHGTIAYLSGDAALEYTTAIAVCCFGAMVATSLQQFEHKMPRTEQEPSDANGWFVAIWVPVLGVLSFPSFMYAVSTSLPAQNALGIGEVVLAIFQNGIGAILYLITSYAIPWLASQASGWAGCKSKTLRGRAMVASRLFITVCVPLVTILIMNQDCGSAWLRLWSRCDDSTAFNTRAYIQGTWPLVSVQVVNHEDICFPGYVPNGKCPRAVVDVMGTLFMKKLSFAAFVSPAVALAQATPLALFVVGHIQSKFSSSNTDTSEVDAKLVDREIAGLVLLIEMPILLGAMVPPLILLAAIALGLNASVFHLVAKVGISVVERANVPFKYLWLSLILNDCLVTWFFWENDLSGKWIVAVGMPVSMGIGAVSYTNQL